MADVSDISFLEWAFKGLVSVVLTLGGYLWVMLIGKVKELDKSVIQANSDLKDHQLYASQTFTTKNDSNRQYDELCRKIDRVLDLISNRPHNTRQDDE